MEVTSFFTQSWANLLAGVAALALFGSGGVALAQQQGVAGVFLILAGFLAVMFLEYRHISSAE
jgi:hypothetical protein